MGERRGRAVHAGDVLRAGCRVVPVRSHEQVVVRHQPDGGLAPAVDDLREPELAEQPRRIAEGASELARLYAVTEQEQTCERSHRARVAREAMTVDDGFATPQKGATPR